MFWRIESITGRNKLKYFDSGEGQTETFLRAGRKESRAPFNNKEIRQIPIDDISVAPGEDFWLNV